MSNDKPKEKFPEPHKEAGKIKPIVKNIPAEGKRNIMSFSEFRKHMDKLAMNKTEKPSFKASSKKEDKLKPLSKISKNGDMRELSYDEVTKQAKTLQKPDDANS